MELTTHQITILIGLTVAQLIAVLVPYWIGRQAGNRQGHAAGYQAGYTAAADKLEAETDEAHQRMSSAERVLTATQAEQRRTQTQLDKARLQHAETIATLQTQLEDAQALTAAHAAFLRQCAHNFDLAAATWHATGATEKERHARTLSAGLLTLAGWLQPATALQGDHLEAAA